MAHRCAKNDEERARITSVYDTERAFLALKDFRPVRARRVDVTIPALVGADKQLERVEEFLAATLVEVLAAQARRADLPDLPRSCRTDIDR